jgi:hypothetical protein
VYVYAQDQYYQEMKEAENLRNRVDVLNQISPYVGLYFSKDYIRRNVLKLTDKEIEQIAIQNEDDPMELQPGMPGADQAIAMDNQDQQTQLQQQQMQQKKAR